MHNIKTYEGFTESLFQIHINSTALADLGIETPIQVISWLLSFITLTKCYADRISYVRNNREMGLMSFEFAKAFVESMFTFLICFLGIQLVTITQEETIPVWMGLILLGTLLHPLFWFLVMGFIKRCSKITFYHCCIMYFTSVYGLTYLFRFVRKASRQRPFF